MPSDAVIEAVARAMILAQGFDPDEDWSVPEPRHIQSGQSPPPEPAWTTVRNEARAALDAAERAAWLPIEEAPRDGTVVDLWLQSVFYDGDGKRQVSAEFRVPSAMWFADRWANEDGNPHELIEAFPDAEITHFRSIPAGPGVKSND